MGSGHVGLDSKSVISPGPVYDTREKPGRGSAKQAGLPTFKFGTASSRTDYGKAAKAPGPGAYSPKLDSSKHAPPRYTMYESYSWRRADQKGRAPPKQPGPAANLMHADPILRHSVRFAKTERFDDY